MATQNTRPFDGSYKAFFSNEIMVQGLFQDFTPPAIFRELDFSTLECCSPDHVTKNFFQYHDDILWRVRWKTTWCYLYIILEFQSTVDYFMAVRVLVYTALLWERLIRNGEIKVGMQLPLVFPAVIYRGSKPWNAPLSLRELLGVVPEVVKVYQPQQEYFLLDEHALSEEAMARATSPTAELFRMERLADSGRVVEYLRQFRKKLQTYPDGLKDIFHSWIYNVFRLSRVAKELSLTELQNILENAAMFEDVCKQWADSLRSEGRKEGLGYMRDTLFSLLEDRFHMLPDSIRGKIAKISFMGDLQELTRSVFRVQDIAEFSELLDAKLAVKP